MDDNDLKELFTPYRTSPRPGFADRVMVRLEPVRLPSVAQGRGGRHLFWFGFGAELAGAVAALWLFLAAMNLPEPAWFTQDEVLPPVGRTAWVSDDAAAMPDWMASDE